MKLEREILLFDKNNILYRKILEELSNCDFDNLDEYTFKNQVIRKIDSEYFYHYKTGSTKLVLFINGIKDIVVKIPFSYGKRSQPLAHNYCHLEEKIYQQAVKVGFEEVFAKTECIGLIDAYPIYVQERVDALAAEDYYEEVSPQSKAFASSLTNSNSEYEEIDVDWLATVVECYGEEYCSSLMDFFYENDINDLHVNNLGYLHDYPVVIDYSGYES